MRRMYSKSQLESIINETVSTPSLYEHSLFIGGDYEGDSLYGYAVVYTSTADSITEETLQDLYSVRRMINGYINGMGIVNLFYDNGTWVCSGTDDADRILTDVTVVDTVRQVF